MPLNDLIITGATGKVGSTLVRKIYDAGYDNVDVYANPIRILGLASSTHLLQNEEGILREDALMFVTRDFSDAQPYASLMDLYQQTIALGLAT